MLSKGFEVDLTVYGYLISAQTKKGNPYEIFNLYEDLKEKLGGFVHDGVVYGSIMKEYFLKGIEKEAMECYEETLTDYSNIKMSAIVSLSEVNSILGS
ncbi:hypothetical protein L1887_22515 [Cichorium endivia]|nr:hypothetical protein L1887_22515 [Cichorium endivia]